MSRALLQALNAVPVDDSPALTPEAQAGFILGFVVVAFVLNSSECSGTSRIENPSLLLRARLFARFALLVLGAYAVFLTGKIKQVYKDMEKLEKRLREVEMKDDDDM